LKRLGKREKRKKRIKRKRKQSGERSFKERVSERTNTQDVL